MIKAKRLYNDTTEICNLIKKFIMSAGGKKAKLWKEYKQLDSFQGVKFRHHICNNSRIMMSVHILEKPTISWIILYK